MDHFSKILIGAGIALVVAGVVWHFGARFLSFGRLPGDIVVERENFKFYFPLATSVLLSVLLSLAVWLFRLFGQKFGGRGG